MRMGELVNTSPFQGDITGSIPVSVSLSFELPLRGERYQLTN